jgi:hypothetical protein
MKTSQSPTSRAKLNSWVTTTMVGLGAGVQVDLAAAHRLAGWGAALSRIHKHGPGHPMVFLDATATPGPQHHVGLGRTASGLPHTDGNKSES